MYDGVNMKNTRKLEIAITLFIGLCVFFSMFANGIAKPPSNVPGKGSGHQVEGKKGAFFVTASGNNPYITFHNSGNSTEDSIFRVKFEKLIFFNDTNGNGEYDLKEDDATNTLVLATLQWTTGDLEQNGDEFTIRLNATSTIFDEMAFVIHYKNGTTNDESNKLKFDIIVTNMRDSAYAGGNSVALKHQLFIDLDGKKGGRELKFSNGTGAKNNSVQVTTGSNEDTGAEFEWEKEASINGTTNPHAVNGTNDDDSKGASTKVQAIYLAFPKFANLTYDPTIAIINPTSLSSVDGYSTELITCNLILTGFIIAVAVHHRKMKRFNSLL
jgi:hypothetical protein